MNKPHWIKLTDYMNDEELERANNNRNNNDAYFEENGKRFHTDKYGKWYINDKGYENLFVNQIQDEYLSFTVEQELEKDHSVTDNKTQFSLEGETFNLFVKPENPLNSAVSRRSRAGGGGWGSTPANSSTYDKLQTANPTKPNYRSGTTANTPQTPSPGGFQGNPNNSKSHYVSYESHWTKQGLEDCLGVRPIEPFWIPDPETHPNCFVIVDPDGTPYIWTKMAHRKKIG